MRTISELNINEGGRPVVRKAPSNALVIEFESEFGVKLPIDYVHLLKTVNGGHPELDSFVPLGDDPNNRWSVDCFYHLTDDRDDTASIWRATQEWGDHLGTGQIPIAHDGGGNQIFMDLRHDKCIYLCIHDQRFKIIKVAPSFAEFLGLLDKDPDMI